MGNHAITSNDGWSVIDELEITREGKAYILAPRKELFMRPDGIYEPAWAPIFYNPVMMDNRSLTVLSSLAHSYFGNKVKSFAEPLAGSCVRSLRMILEANTQEAYANDIDPYSVYVCRANARLNNIADKVIIFNADANLFTLQLDNLGIPIDFVDIDPYGTPIYYLQSSIKLIAKNGILSVTATDVGTLEGKYPYKAFSRYGVLVTKNSFSKEVAARVLLYTLFRFSAFQDRVIEPILTFYDKHYVKIVVKVEKASSTKIRELERNVGYIVVDSNGLPIHTISVNEPIDTREDNKVIGPLWLGPICNQSYLEKIIELSLNKHVDLSKEALSKLRTVLEECRINTPYYFNLPLIAKILKANIPKINYVLETLRNKGFLASRTHFDLLSIKTNAPLEEVSSLFSFRS